MIIREIVEATHGQLLSGCLEDQVRGFSQDTRQIKEGDFYIPLIGENADGHDYIDKAIENGAIGFITDHKVDYPECNVILVEDTLKALGDMAAYLRKHRDVRVVGITGSVGKTSTKDMIYAVVSMKYKTLKTLGNYNNHIGLPLTILRHSDEEVMILEMGMNHLKEISYLTHIACPDIAAITNVGTAHIGELGSRENILKAKMEIVEGLNQQGTLVINDDNDLLHTVKEDGYHLVRVGLNNGCDLQATNIKLNVEDSTFDLEYKDKVYQVHVSVPGEHFVLNALIAIAIGIELDIDMDLCIKGVETFELTKNRNDVITLKGDIKVIDGTYNANLDSMKASIDVLSKYPSRRIAVLADMLELGDYEEELHRTVGKYVADKDIDLLLCVGSASEYIVEEALSNGVDAYHFDNNEALLHYLNEIIEDKDVLLVKGSNGMHLKEIVNDLKEKKS